MEGSILCPPNIHIMRDEVISATVQRPKKADTGLVQNDHYVGDSEGFWHPQPERGDCE